MLAVSALSVCVALSSCKLTEFVGNIGVEDITQTTAPITAATGYTTAAVSETSEVFTDGRDYGLSPVPAVARPEAFPNGVRLASSGSVKVSGEDIISREDDTSAALAITGGELTLDKVTLMSSSSSTDSLMSRFYGLCSGVLSYPRSKADVLYSDINTTGKSASAAFSYGTGAVINITGGSLTASGENSHGVAVTYKGELNSSDCVITANGINSPAVFAGRGGGTINITGGSVTSTGAYSPAVYSAGTVALTGTKLSSSLSEAGVVEGKSSLTLTGCSSHSETGSFLLCQTNSGEASAGLTTLSLHAGSVDNGTGALFTVSNTDAEIFMQGVDISTGSSSLVNAVANDKWGKNGENGGNVHITANFQKLKGNVYADNFSTVTLELSGLSVFSGSINSQRTAKEANIILDASSVWNVTGNSFVSALTPGLADYSCIKDNGYTVYYDKSNPVNVYLNGETITLQDGGILTPAPN